MKTTTEAFEVILDSAKLAAASAKANRVRVISEHKTSPDTLFEIRQGDVHLYMTEFSESDMDGWERTGDMQLAPGTSKGSRHILDDPSAVEVYVRKVNSDPLEGPRFRVKERTLLNHPDHNIVSLPPGDYAARFQRDYTQEHIARVAD